MIDVRCRYDNGDVTVTSINLTLEQAKEYFVGKYFNLGAEVDRMVRCISCEPLELEEMKEEL